jgi:hypothetical protein
MPNMVHTVMPTDIYQPSPRRQRLLHRITRDARRALPHLARRAVSATLRLSWQLDITVIIDADVFTDDSADAAALFEQYLLHPDTRLVAYAPSDGPTGWRDIATASIAGLRDVTVAEDGNADINFPWSARALTTLRITVAADDLDPDMYLDIEPEAPATGTVRNILTVIHTVNRTAVHRRR